MDYEKGKTLWQASSKQKNSLILTWENISAVLNNNSFPHNIINRNSSKRNIISNQYGEISNSQLVALIGSSGSGKTTLLNGLSFRRVQSLTVTGKIKVNGVEMNKELMTLISSYVQQEDVFIGTLTVKEHLMFHAKLKMHNSKSKKEIENKVNEIINELILIKCQNTQIGIKGVFKGISFGEQKRLSIATEILHDPLILFCDEPTSGLDSSMSHTVVESLRKIANSGKIVLTTIHHPSSGVFAMFDYVYGLYNGKLALSGKRSEISSFLAGMDYKCPPQYNLADFIINKLSLHPNTLEFDMMRINRLVDNFQKNSLYSDLLKRINLNNNNQKKEDSYLNDRIKYRIENQSPFYKQIFSILRRNGINFFRDRTSMFMRVQNILFFAIIVGFTLFQQHANQEQFELINRSIFIALMGISMLSVVSPLLSYPSEYPILCKENDSRVYSVASYFIANVIFEIPVYLIMVIIFDVINYWLVGLNPNASRFFINYALLVAVAFNGLACGHALSVIGGNSITGVVLATPIFLYHVIMNEHFLYGYNSVVEFLKYTSWLYYSYNLLVYNEWKDVSSIPGPAAKPTNGNDVLDIVGIKTSDVYGYVIGLVGLIFFWRAIGVIALLIRIKYY